MDVHISYTFFCFMMTEAEQIEMLNEQPTSLN